jgi:SRSO17 transposase
MARVRPRLEAFAGQLLGPALRRAEQRVNGELYLRGLLTDGARKSMQPMAQRLGVDHQRLQQFVSSSTWDYTVVRANLARWALGAVGPDAYVIDDVGFPKDGDASPGVARQYCGALGKTGNCQVGVSVHLVTDTASAAVDWRLFLPESWDDTTTDDPVQATRIRARRARSKILDDVRHVEKWRLALDMLDEATGSWGLPADRPVVADCGYGDATAFRLGLTDRGLTYVLAVKPTTSAYPPTRCRSYRPIAAGDAHRSRVTATARRTCAPWRWPRVAARCVRSPGVTAPDAAGATPPPRCARGSWPCGCAQPTGTSPRPRRGAAHGLAAGRMATRRG